MIRKNATNQTYQLKHNSNYRPDIDGLRAIACLAVVLYHAFPGRLPGGFIGVDIFFVISGYLISSILYRHLFNQETPGKVHIVDFYSRRVRRIFPALILVLVTTLVLGYFVLLPEEYKLLGKHTFGGSTYINNFMLYKETGNYFNVDSKFKPLLHLWSLGVEEQFYLVFPIFLWLIYKLNLNFVLSLTLFSIISFFINYNAVKHGFVSKAFFMPWTRFWELSLGAVLAYVEFEYAKQLYQFKDSKFYKTVLAILFRNPSDSDNQKLLKNILSVIGLVLIVVGLITIKSNGVYPGKKALIPVFGALFIIAAGKDAFINRLLLSNKVMVFLGLISYPLYLWHWPLLSLLYICDGGIPERQFKVIAILISLLLATITFLFIEPKLRYGKHAGIKAIVLFLVLLAVGGAGLKIKHDDGLPQRFKEQILSSEELLRRERTKKYQGGNYLFYIDDKYTDNCRKELPFWKVMKGNGLNCAFQNKAGENNIAIIGSSHASHLFYGLKEYYKNSEKSFALFPVSWQLPYKDLKLESTDCHWLIQKAYDYVNTSKNIKTVILADYAPNGVKYIDLRNPKLTDQKAIYKNAVERSFEMLKNLNVLVILDNPMVPYNPSICITNRPFSLKKSQSCSFIKYENKVYDMHKEVVRSVAKKFRNVKIFEIEKLFCQNEYCNINKDDRVIMQDQEHLSIDGSLYVAPFIAEQIEKFKKQ